MPSIVRFRIEMPGTPTVKYRSHGGLVNPEKVCKRLEIRREGDDRANIQIPIRPAIQPVADTRCQRIIHGRVAKGTLNAHGLQATLGLEKTGYANDGVKFKQRQCGRRVIEIDFAFRRGSETRPVEARPESTFRPTAKAVLGLTPGPTPPSFAPSIA